MSGRQKLGRAGREIAGDHHVITIKKNKTSRALKDAVEVLSGVDLSVCFQCKKCSSGCPVGKLAKTRPSEIMRLAAPRRRR